MNQVHLLGNIGREPEFKTFVKSGKRKAKFSVALNYYTKDKKQVTTWIPCEMWDVAADRLFKCREQASLKGSKIQITGTLSVNEWFKDQGETAQRITQVVVKVLSFQLLPRERNTGKDEEIMQSEPEESLAEPAELPEAISEAPSKTRAPRRKTA